MWSSLILEILCISDPHHAACSSCKISTKVRKAWLLLITNSHMSKLMSDGESSTKPIILNYGTAMILTDGAQLSKAKGVTVVVGRDRVAADIFPAKFVISGLMFPKNALMPFMTCLVSKRATS